MWPARKRKSLTVTTMGDQNIFSPCFGRHGSIPYSGEQSPMTVLSNTLSCVTVDTPKRCLFLGFDGGPDTPIGINTRTTSESSDAGCFMDSPSPRDSAFSVVDQFRAASARPGSLRRSSLTRVKPFSLPGHSKSVLRGTSIEEGQEERCLPRPRSASLANTALCMDKENVQSQVTTTIRNASESPPLIKEVTFSFAKPVIIPSAATSSPLSSPRSKKDRPTSAPALLFEPRRRAQTMVDDSPVTLRHSRLTSSDDDDRDDGFSDIFMDSDSNEAANNEVSSHFAGLMQAPIIHAPSPKKSTPSEALFTSPTSSCALRDLDCNTLSDTPGPKCRRGIFKVPSQPVIRRSGSFLKRQDRPNDCPSPVMNKRARSCSIAACSPSVSLIRPEPFKASVKPLLSRSLSATAIESNKVNHQLGADPPSPDLIGDNSKPYCLPLCAGKNRNLKSLSPETMCQLINSNFSDEVEEYHVIDCRFPYEYQGGHIKGAKNLYNKELITEFFLNNPMVPLDKRRVIVFHCEFSSKRGPSMLNFLRNKDRDLHATAYPALHYPELYILEGGYKAFFESHKTCCEPQTYKPMDHEEHRHDLKHFKAKAKSWAGERSRLKLHSRKLISSSSENL